jgi:predicted alpha/beta hydrolase family esterase
VPELAEFLPAPLDRASLDSAARSTRLVCAPDDPYCPEGAVFSYGHPLRLDVDEIAHGGHLNADAGYGAWPAVEDWTLDGAAVPLSSNRVD